MSYTEAKLVAPDGSFHSLTRFGNSHGFAARVWSALDERYLGRHGYQWLLDPQPLWNLWLDERLPAHHRLVLLSTFDWAIIETNRLEEMASHYRQFARGFPSGPAVDHLSALAALFERVARENADALGVCFHAMSVSADPWRVYEERPDEERDYDLARDTKHFFVFEALEAHLAEKAASGGALDAGDAGDL